MASTLHSRVRPAGSTVVLELRRRLAEARYGAEQLDARLAASESIAPAAIEELAQLGCRLLELAAVLAERDGVL
jgi:hypothetical protein